MSGAIHRVSHNIVYDELGWDSLKSRRHKQRLKVFYKTLHGETPQYLANEINRASSAENYTLRSGDHLIGPQTKSASFLDSFFPSTTDDWNELSNETKLSTSCEAFMRALNTNIVKPPSWFLTGTRKENTLHARLRMLCSPLNDHLHSFIHVADKPDCACGFPRENNKHYLLDCPVFCNERNTMLKNLVDINFNPTVSNLLKGDPELDQKINSKAFKIIQHYILSTKRFD